MPSKTLLAGAVSLLGTLSLSSTALAGHCAPGQACNMPVQTYNDYAPRHDAMTVRSTPPGHYSSSVVFQGAPNVSITRVHGMMPSAALSDAPSAFTGGCHPESTAYCRQDAGTPVTVEMNTPAPMPSYQPAPVVAAPAPVMAPQQPLRTWIGKGYDPSKFTPRTYGDATMTPGIAYLPTSRVVRDPAAAQAVLNSGRTVPQSTVLGGTAPTPAMTAPMMGAPMMGAPVMNVPAMAPAMRAPVMNAPMMGGMNHMTQNRVAPNRVVTGRGSYGPTPPAVLTAPAVSYGNAPQTVLKESPVPMPAMAPVTQDGKTYVSNIGADGTYWEKTSGLTTFGSTVATQVICKRKVEQKVVNPVVGVPVPVPTRVVNPIVRVPVAVPTPVEIPVQQECVSVPHNHGGVMHGARGPRFVGMQPHMGHQMPARPMPAHPMNGRWTY